MTYKSKYISKKFSVPDGWTPEEFWWAVEQLEKFGDENNLFDLAWDLGIKYDKSYKGKIPVDELILVIITEGGPKNEIIEAIENLAQRQG